MARKLAREMNLSLDQITGTGPGGRITRADVADAAEDSSAMPAPADIEVKCFVNGEQRQAATFDQLIFAVPEIIAVLSSGMSLLPGDIIATGTPAGVGMGFRPPKYLQPGDEVVVDITGVGELRNPVV